MAWLSVWSEVQTCIWPSWCHCHSLSLASVKFRLVLPFWYRLTRVVPEKGPLNRCVCVQYVNKKLKVLNQNVTSWSPISDPNYHNHSNIDTRTAELPAIFQLAHSKCQQLDDKKTQTGMAKVTWPTGSIFGSVSYPWNGSMNRWQANNLKWPQWLQNTHNFTFRVFQAPQTWYSDWYWHARECVERTVKLNFREISLHILKFCTTQMFFIYKISRY